MAESWKEAWWKIEAALADDLPQLPRPAPTAVMAERLARVTGYPQDMVAKILLRMAADHPNATHNGVVKMRFGRQVTGWLWNPVVQRAGASTQSFTCLACGRVRPAQEFRDLADRRCVDCPPLRTTQGLEDLL